MRAYFLAIVFALGLVGCTQVGFEPNNENTNSEIIYNDAGGGE